MANTIEEFIRETRQQFLHRLTPEERQAVLDQLPPEEVIAHFTPEERLRGLGPEERLHDLGPEELRQLEEYLKALAYWNARFGRYPAPPPPERFLP